MESLGGPISTLDMLSLITMPEAEYRQFKRDQVQMWTLRSLELGRYEARENADLIVGQVHHLGERLSGELRAVGGMLQGIHDEMNKARLLQEQHLAAAEESLALQKAMRESQLLQEKLQEFIFQFSSTVERFTSPQKDEYPATTRLLVLKGFLAQILAENIDTPMINGLENKRAFAQARDAARRLVDELSRHPEVLAAVEWARRERERVREEEEQRRREQEAQERRRRQAEEQRQRQIEALQGEEREVGQQVKEIEKEIKQHEGNLVSSFSHWFKGKFGFDHKVLVALAAVCSLMMCCGSPLTAMFFSESPADTKGEAGKITAINPDAGTLSIKTEKQERTFKVTSETKVMVGAEGEPVTAGSVGELLKTPLFKIGKEVRVEADEKGEVAKTIAFEKWTTGGIIAGLLCFAFPAPLVLIGLVFIVFSIMHRTSVGDVEKHQQELDATVNASPLADIARLKEKVAPLKERLTGVRQQIADLKAGRSLAQTPASSLKAQAPLDPDLAELERLEQEEEQARRRHHDRQA